MDDGVPCAFPGRVVEHLVVEDEAADLDDPEEQDEEERGHEGELDESLAAGPVPRRARTLGCTEAHGLSNAKSEMAKMLVLRNVRLWGRPRRVLKKSMPTGAINLNV